MISESKEAVPKQHTGRTLIVTTVAIASLVLLAQWHKAATQRTNTLIAQQAHMVSPQLTKSHETLTTNLCIEKLRGAFYDKNTEGEEDPLKRFPVSHDMVEHFADGRSARGVVRDGGVVSSSVRDWVQTYLDGQTHVHKRKLDGKHILFLFGDNTVVQANSNRCQVDAIYFPDAQGNFHGMIKYRLAVRGNIIPSPVPGPPPRYRQHRSDDGPYPPGCNTNTDVAINKPTWQSSTGWGGVSSRAADGNTDQNYGHGSCTHTQKQALPFWYVDLGRNMKVCSVVVYNRQDCCWSRMKAIMVSLTRTPPPNPFATNTRAFYAQRTVHIPLSFSSYRFIFSQAYDARYVTIVNLVEGQQYLTICEVQVNIVGSAAVVADGAKYLGCQADWGKGWNRMRKNWSGVTSDTCKWWCGSTFRYFGVKKDSNACACGNGLEFTDDSQGVTNSMERCGGVSLFENV